MKKTYVKYSVLCLGLAAMLAFGGCGGKDDSETTTEKTQTMTDVVTETTTEAVTEAQPTVDSDGFTVCNEVVKTLDYVNIRTAPSTDADIYQQAPIDAEFTRIGTKDDWSKISLDDGEYYVSSQFVQAVDALGADTSEEGSSEAGETAVTGEGRVVVIDAGHQQTANDETEPIGPAATETKVKATTGNTGVSTGIAEYELNLEIALRLEAELTARGYTVKMVRTTNDVDISNATRAEYANNQNADAVIKIHTNGSTDSSATGVMTVCQTSENPYNASIYDKCKALATEVLSGLVASTGAESDGIWETDNMSGINWSAVPVTIVEVGYMTTASEEALLVTEDYQNKLAKGIADGIDAYIAGQSE